MNLFDPRTFSTDWEVMVVDKLLRSVPTEKLMGFAGALQSELDLPIKIDWNTIEFALGINHSLEQIEGRIRRATDRAAQMVGEFDCDLFPAGSHPLEEMFNASHVHVGTIHDESAAIRLENQMLRWVPAFAALAANSPATRGQVGPYKSWRVREQAHGCTRPGSIRDPGLSQYVWGSDVGPKFESAPTVEVRITDGASSRRLLAELAVFVAAFLHHRATRMERDAPPTPEEYRDSLTNRWAAARWGMQATFRWNGAARPVADLLGEMLDGCAEALLALGARRSDLALVNAMIERRVCQADFVLDLARRYPDPYLLAAAHAKLARHWTVFDEYAVAARPLDPAPLPDEETILAEHLAVIGEGSHVTRSREAMYYPPPVADALLEEMIERGLVRREVTENRGIVLSRI
jgi:gamma-glutamyl:cysteine ligase YbdK (ATP-grasp superfamily)